MDALIGVFILAAGVAAFVMMVRNIKAKSAQSQPQQLPVSRPKPLSKAQRKSLGLPTPKAAPIDTASTEQPKRTRAIRTGWSRGDIAFTYEDAAGDITSRTVTVHSVTATYIKGECHDNAAERTFRIDRVIGDITDCATGEIFSAKRWATKNKN